MIFGAAKPTPVDLRNTPNPRLANLVVSAAGPVSNFLLAAVGIALLAGRARRRAGRDPRARSGAPGPELRPGALAPVTYVLFQFAIDQRRPRRLQPDSDPAARRERGRGVGRRRARRIRLFRVIAPFGFLILILLLSTRVLGAIVRPFYGIVIRSVFGAGSQGSASARHERRAPETALPPVDDRGLERAARSAPAPDPGQRGLDHRHPDRRDHRAVHGVSRRHAGARPRRRLRVRRARGRAHLHQVEDAPAPRARGSRRTRGRISRRASAEYERFKQAAENLHGIDTLRAGLWPRGGAAGSAVARGGDARGLALRPDRRVPQGHGAATASRTRRRWRSGTSASRSRRRCGSWSSGSRRAAGALPLLEFLGEMRYRAEAVTAFLATLELVRLGSRDRVSAGRLRARSTSRGPRRRSRRSTCGTSIR